MIRAEKLQNIFLARRMRFEVKKAFTIFFERLTKTYDYFATPVKYGSENISPQNDGDLIIFGTKRKLESKHNGTYSRKQQEENLKIISGEAYKHDKQNFGWIEESCCYISRSVNDKVRRLVADSGTQIYLINKEDLVNNVEASFSGKVQNTKKRSQT